MIKAIKLEMIVILSLLVLFITEVSGEQAMPDLVVTGSRVPIGFSRLTRDVTVIDCEEIERLKVDSVAEILNYAAGIDVQSRGVPGVQSDIAMRGATYQQVLILVDGIRVNDPQTDHHNMDIPLNPGDIERIEVLHGHGSSVYGAAAFGGVVNIITKDARKSETGFGMGGGQFNSLNSSFSFSRKWNRFGQRFSASRKKSAGFRYGTEYDITNVSGLSTLDADDVRFKLSLGLVDKLFGAYDFYTPGGDWPSKEITRTKSVNLQISGKGHYDGMESRLYWRRHDDEFILDRTFEKSSYVNEHATFLYGVEAHIQTGNVAAGVDVSEEMIYSLSLGTHRRMKHALFVEMAKNFDSRYDLNSGIRFDSSDWGLSMNPTLGLGWWFLPKWKLRVSGGKAFRVPSFTELYYDSPMNKGDANLNPEEVISIECGLDFNNEKDFLFKFTIFDRMEYNLIDRTREIDGDPWQAVNTSEGNMLGIESSVLKKWKPLTLSVKYSWNKSLRAEQVYFSKYALRFPIHQLGINISSDALWGLSNSCHMIYKKRQGENGYLLVNLITAKKIGGIEVFARADNLMNVTYEEITGVPCPGRWVSAGIKLGTTKE